MQWTRHRYQVVVQPKQQQCTYRWNITSRLFLLILLFEHGTCLAASNHQDTIHKIVSVNKSGGDSKEFIVPTSHDIIHEKVASSETSSEKQQNESKNNSRSKNALLLNTSMALKKFQSGLRSTFLPLGFPDKTPPGYLNFSVWSWIQDLSTQLRSVLATQRVLEGVGVGKEGATALSALMNFLVRDGCGMAANLLFTSTSSSKFNTDIKRWRLFADLMVDLGITLEVTAGLFSPAFFLPMISIGNMCKAMCGVAAGATGGAINLHWAKGSDISDVSAKFGAQHTVTGALGLVFAAFFARSINDVNPWQLWSLYTFLTVLHIYANVKCMRSVAFDSFNTARLNLVMTEFFSHSDTTNDQLPQLSLSGPTEIAKREPLFFFGLHSVMKRIHNRIPILYGCSFHQYWDYSWKKERPLQALFVESNENYIISCGSCGWSNRHRRRNRQQPCVVVSLLSGITPQQETKAYFHANVLSRAIYNEWKKNRHSIIGNDQLELIERKVREETLPKFWDAFLATSSSAGWDMDKVELQSLGYEVRLIPPS